MRHRSATGPIESPLWKTRADARGRIEVEGKGRLGGQSNGAHSTAGFTARSGPTAHLPYRDDPSDELMQKVRMLRASSADLRSRGQALRGHGLELRVASQAFWRSSAIGHRNGGGTARDVAREQLDREFAELLEQDRRGIMNRALHERFREHARAYRARLQSLPQVGALPSMAGGRAGARSGADKGQN